MRHDKVPNFITRPLSSPDQPEAPRPTSDRFHARAEVAAELSRVTRLRQQAYRLSVKLGGKTPPEPTDRAVWRDVMDGK